METGAVLQSRGERTKGFSETGSSLNYESQDRHPAHPGANEAEKTHAGVPELMNVESPFHIIHPAAHRCNSIS